MVLAIHPFLFAYYTKGVFSKRFKWWLKYKRWVNLVKDTSLGITEFHFLNKDGEEIEMGLSRNKDKTKVIDQTDKEVKDEREEKEEEIED